MKLSGRLTVVFGLLGAVAVTVMAVVSWVLAANEVRSAIDAELTARTDVVSQFIAAGRTGIDADLEAPSSAEPFSDDESGVGLHAVDGTVLVAGPVPLVPESDRPEPGAEAALLDVETDDGRYRVAVIAVAPDRDAAELAAAADVEADLQRVYVQFHREITDEEAALTSLALRLASAAAISMLAVAVGSWYVGRWLARPLNQLTATVAELVEPGAPPGRIELARGDEIGTLATQFNRMLSALEVGREQQRRLVADASHELRTPLTSLRMRTEFLAANATLAVDDRQAHLDAAVTDVEHLSLLVGDLVDLAADVRTGDEQPERLAMREIIDDVVDQVRMTTGREIAVESDETRAEVRPTMIRRALRNLLDNADKYSPDDTPILVRSRGGRIEVADRGEGIAAEELALVFDRFYRSPKARTRPGNGIGLAIVAQVADVHRGTTWARSGEGGGAVVGFSIRPDPVFSPRSP